MSDADKPYSEEEIKELFEGLKESFSEKYPEIKDEIGLCKTGAELDEVIKGHKGFTEPQNGAEAPKTLGVVKHIHSIMKKEKEDEDDSENLNEGGEDLSKTGGQVPLQNWGQKPKSWENHEQMLDDLFKMETLGKIESTRDKPNREIVEKGTKAGEMIEKLYRSGMKSGRLTRASKDMLRGRFSFEEPEWFRKARNPLGRKRAKEKPYLVESL